MVRDDVTLSSIALLQERFRQLQRMKELRQERELMRTLSDPHAAQSPTSAVFRQRAPPPPPPAIQLALSLWPDSRAELAKPYHSPTQLPRFNLDTSECDIDTSLRL